MIIGVMGNVFKDRFLPSLYPFCIHLPFGVLVFSVTELVSGPICQYFKTKSMGSYYKMKWHCFNEGTSNHLVDGLEWLNSSPSFIIIFVTSSKSNRLNTFLSFDED